MPPTHKDENLLCEQCGYGIGGLPMAGRCPECGRSIESSLPGSRPGSPWQVERSWAGRRRTYLAALRWPGVLFEQMRIRGAPDRALLAGSIGMAGVLVALAVWAGLLRAMYAADGRLTTGAVLGAAALAAIFGGYGSVAVLYALTAIEHRGVRFFGAQRGWRITPAVATSVCAHASVGWLIAGVLVLLGTLLGMWAESGAATAPKWLLPLLRRAPVVLALAGFMSGLLVFETLVFIGVRRCRFANT